MQPQSAKYVFKNNLDCSERIEHCRLVDFRQRKLKTVDPVKQHPQIKGLGGEWGKQKTEMQDNIGITFTADSSFLKPKAYLLLYHN